MYPKLIKRTYPHHDKMLEVTKKKENFCHGDGVTRPKKENFCHGDGVTRPKKDNFCHQRAQIGKVH